MEHKQMTHKQLANIVLDMSGRGMNADFAQPAEYRDWAFAAAVFKRPRVNNFKMQERENEHSADKRN